MTGNEPHLELLVHGEPRLGGALVLLALFLYCSCRFAIRLGALLMLLQKSLLFALKAGHFSHE